MLNSSPYGYRINSPKGEKLSHLLYMDDLKLYSSTKEHLRNQLELVSKFSETIGMEFGLDKCAVMHVKKGAIQSEQSVKLMNGTEINCLEPTESYKYLGFQQALGIRTTEMKEQIKNELKNRVKKVLKTKLNAKNSITAINTWALPVVGHTFGVLKWSPTDLQALDRMVRTLLTSHRSHHPNSSVARLYISRMKGGRGLLSIESNHLKQKLNLINHFNNTNLPLYHALIEADKNYTPLNLSNDKELPQRNSEEQWILEWRSKAIHGRFAAALHDADVDKDESSLYLRSGWLTRETEGMISAIQDQVVATRYYSRCILKLNIPTDLCRVCGQKPETINHIIGGCSVIAPKEYLHRHNSIAKIIHQNYCNKNGLSVSTERYYNYQPEAVLENGVFKVYWDTLILTDRQVPHNKPDILIINKATRSAFIVDFAVPLNDNIGKTYVEKIVKYQDLSYELKRIYQLESIEVLPFIISSTGLIEKRLTRNIVKLGLEKELACFMQKAAILETCHIVRRYLLKEL